MFKSTTLFCVTIIVALCICSFKPLKEDGEILYVATDYIKQQFLIDQIEGPAVDKDGNLYAVQYTNGTIGKITPGQVTSLFVTLPSGSTGNGIRFDSKQNMYIADYTKHKILKVNMLTKAVTTYATNANMNQPNDIAIGKNDLIYASDPNWANNTGNLWRVNLDGTTTLLEANMGTTNGVEVAPNEKILYVNESVQRNIWAYDLSNTGTISNKRLLISFPDFGLDGMRTDIDGNLYVARFGKGVIAKISPEGVLLKEITLTGNNPTNLAFGGTDGRTCYVTVGDRGLIETFRVEKPGREWALAHPDVTGIQQENSTLNVTVYPNPSTGSFKISVPEAAETAFISLHQLNGTTIYQNQHKVINGQIQFNSHLEAGIYLAKINVNGKGTEIKLVIE